MNLTFVPYLQPTGKIPLNLGPSAEKVEKTPGLFGLMNI